MNLKLTATTRRLFYLGFALVASILYDVFLWNKERGLGFTLFIVLFVSGFLAIAVSTKQLYRKSVLWLLVPIAILSADVMIYNNELVQYLVPVVVGALLLVLMILSTVRNPNSHPFAFWNIPVVRNATIPFIKWGQILHDLFPGGDSPRRDVYRKIVAGVIIAIPIILIFTALFAGADAIFLDWVQKMYNFKPETLWRIGRTGFLTLVLGGIMYAIFNEDHKLCNITRSTIKIDPIIVVTILSLVNVLFLIFVAIQIRYLFGSSEFVLTSGLTFAEYARRGFFELVWVMVFSLGLMAAMYRSLAHHGYSKFATVLKILLIIQVEVIAVSALRRMYLYQEEYGFTEQRLYVEWFIYFIMILLAALGASMLKRVSFKKVFYGAFVAGLAAFTAVASFNVQGRIADRNIARYYAGKNLDILYLLTLSSDVRPQIISVLANNPDQSRIIGYSTAKRQILVQSIVSQDAHNSWLETNLSVIRALQAGCTINNICKF